MTGKSEELRGVDHEDGSLMLALSTASSRAIAPAWLVEFVVESNRIEGITRPPTEAEVNAHVDLLDLPAVSVGVLELFVQAVCGEVLRDEYGMDVRVGNHYPQRGGPAIREQLDTICICVNDRRIYTPYQAHVAYEKLHPFMDGNGRSGRALWLWMMQRDGCLQRASSLGFLHAFYYQTLDAAQ